MEDQQTNIPLKASKNATWQGFVFLRDVDDLRRSDPESRGTVSTSPVFPLAQASVGDRVLLHAISSNTISQSLLTMGITPGSVLQVISHLDSGSVIVVLDRQQIGLGAQIAQAVLVRQLRQEE